MKKVLVSLMLASFIVATSCKGKEENKDVETEVITEVETETDLILENKDSDGFVDIEIPEFSNEKVVENLKEYSLFARNYIAAKDDDIKLYDLREEGKRILKDGRELVGKLTKEDQNNYAKTIALIQTKIQE